MNTRPYKIGIDLGGTKIEAIVLDSNNRELWRKRIPTEQRKGYHSILTKIKSLYEEAVLSINHCIHTLGMGIPGTISKETNRVKNANTTCLIDQYLKEDLVDFLKHDIEIHNDANCFTLAEATMGAGVGENFVFGVIMGTGCGGGIYIDGKIHVGSQGIAGEWGHMQINPDGPLCYCGRRGCVETYISGGGVEKMYAESFGESKTMEEITVGYRQGDPDCKKIFEKFLENYGLALANLINILDPDLVVLGGGLSNIDELYTKGREEVEKNIFSDSFKTPIVKNRLGDSSGVIGAALIGK